MAKSNMKWLKLIWKDNVISGIIVAVIIAGTGAWFWEYVKRAMITVGGWASYKVTLPVWAVFIISLILLSLIPVLMLYAKSKVGGDSVEPKFFKYTKDNIFGINVTWRWSREGANKQVISSQADSLIKISRIWADFFPANTSNQPI